MNEYEEQSVDNLKQMIDAHNARRQTKPAADSAPLNISGPAHWTWPELTEDGVTERSETVWTESE